jgi:hypothetical protein
MMSNIEELWYSIESVNSHSERIKLIFRDINDHSNLYKTLADNDPDRLFKLLGGDEADAELTNWAFVYTYEDHIEYYNLEYDSDEAELWDVEERSIERAIDSGHFYVTGLVTLKSNDSTELLFELQFTEGRSDGIIGTPYDENIGSEIHGIEFV